MEKDVFWHRNPDGKLVVKEFAADSALALLRVSDPILDGIAQGYSNQTLVGDKLFPIVPMEKESGVFPAWGKEAFKIYDTKRGLYQPVKHLVSQSGKITATLSEYSFGFEVDRRELNEYAGGGDQLLTGRQMQVSDSLLLQRESAQAVLATTSSNYATGNYYTGAAKLWASTGDPITDMRALMLAVLKKTGKHPNKAWFTPSAWELAINNAAVLARIKYGGSPITPAQMSANAMAELLQVDEVLVPYAVYGTGSGGGKGQAALTMNWLWEQVAGACAGVAWVGGGFMVPSFGYTYQRKNSPIVESYYDPKQKSQVYDTEMFYDSFVTLTEAGAMYDNLA